VYCNFRRGQSADPKKLQWQNRLDHSKTLYASLRKRDFCGRSPQKSQKSYLFVFLHRPHAR
ncbi:MAG: hypothetical protein RBT75_20450, partial [Anaerolineae bacterium]|nr:hypothetical protein [Anaerolineae bacterium]